MDCPRRPGVLSDDSLTESDLRWPQDPHGDGLRRLRANGFDFSKPVVIDFKVYFEAWPAHPEAMLRLTREYTSVSSCGTDDEVGGFLEFQVYALLTYDLVTNTMSYVTESSCRLTGARVCPGAWSSRGLNRPRCLHRMCWLKKASSTPPE